MCELELFYCACCKKVLLEGNRFVCKILTCSWTSHIYIAVNNCKECLRHHWACVIYPTLLYYYHGVSESIPARMAREFGEKILALEQLNNLEEVPETKPLEIGGDFFVSNPEPEPETEEIWIVSED